MPIECLACGRFRLKPTKSIGYFSYTMSQQHISDDTVKSHCYIQINDLHCIIGADLLQHGMHRIFTSHT